MIRTEKTILIDRPIEDVFDYLADFKNDMQWRSELAEIRQTTGFARGQGARYEQRLTWGDREADADFEVVEYEPNRHIGFRGSSGSLSARGDYELDAEDGRTRLRVVGELELSGVLEAAEEMIGDAVQRAGEEDLRHLKDILESR
ncbi:MAG: SRPBCC family protein [Coriobacteriia bacterium]|nr:SRPBCC family protein [Coriobacteriia bacterium]